MSVLNKIAKHKIISVIRSDMPNIDINKVVESLYLGGIRIIEISMNTPDALGKLEQVRKDFPDIIMGVGTVLDEETARLAILSNADFLLSPSLNKNVIKMANRYSVPIIPGALTPTEVLTA